MWVFARLLKVSWSIGRAIKFIAEAEPLIRLFREFFTTMD